MKTLSLRLRAAIGVLTLVGVVAGWGAGLLHGHHDLQFRPTCPACQQERVVSGQPSEVQLGPVGLLPIFVPGGDVALNAVAVPLDPIPAQQSPRSPPPAA